MILKAAPFERALLDPTTRWTVALLYGPDDAGSRAFADRFAATMPADAERIDLDGAVLKDDPARLPDEANALSMFGGRRWIRVTGGDEVLKAVEALLDAPKGVPVIIVSGNLPKSSALVKLADKQAGVIAHQSWKLEGVKADALAIQIGQARGARLTSEAARMLAEATGGDRGLMAQEIEKLALYVDAAPDRPRAVERGDVEAVGASIDVREPWEMIDALFDGQSAALASEISGDARTEPISALRGVQRRAIAIAQALAARKGGPAPRLFNAREREAVERETRFWNAADLPRAHARAMEAEAAVKRPATAGDVVAAQILLGLARGAERMR